MEGIFRVEMLAQEGVKMLERTLQAASTVASKKVRKRVMLDERFRGLMKSLRGMVSGWPQRFWHKHRRGGPALQC